MTVGRLISPYHRVMTVPETTTPRGMLIRPRVVGRMESQNLTVKFVLNVPSAVEVIQFICLLLV